MGQAAEIIYVHVAEIINNASHRDHMCKPPRSYVQVAEVICTRRRDYIRTSRRDHTHKSPRSYVQVAEIICTSRRDHTYSRRDHTYKSPRDHVCTSSRRDHLYKSPRSFVQNAEIKCTSRRDQMHMSRRDRMYKMPRPYVQYKPPRSQGVGRTRGGNGRGEHLQVVVEAAEAEDVEVGLK